MEETTNNTVQTEAVQSNGTKDEKTDYKALYEATLAERNAERVKSKNLEDSLKGYKDKEEEERKKQMTPEERSTEEIDERDKTIATLTARLNRNEVEKVFASEGYKESEYTPIVDLISSNEITDKEKTYEHRILVAKKILEFVKKEKEKFEESERVKGIQHGIQYMGGEGAKSDSQFKQWQSTREKENKGKVKL